MKELYNKYEEIIIYLIVGVLTTIVSWGACFVAKLLGLDPDIKIQNFIINTIGWVVGVLFAYPLNRKWVFKSSNPHILKEFFGRGRICRLPSEYMDSGHIDYVCFYQCLENLFPSM